MKQNKDSLSLQRQIDLAKRYYEVDDQKKTIQLVLTYNKASEILIQDIGNLKNPLLDQNVMKRIKDIIDTFPDGYSVDLKFIINDYEGYDPNVLLESFNDKLEFNNYGARSDANKGWFKALLLTIAGLIMMLFKIHAKTYSWFPSGMESEAFDMIFDSFATLLIWEAGTVMFLTPSNHRNITKTFLKRISSVSFYSAEDKKRLAKESGEEILKNWVQGNKVSSAGRSLLIICSFLFSIQALTSFSTCLETIMNNPFPWQTSTILTFISYVLGFVWGLICVLAGFEYYLEKGKLRLILPFLAISSFVLSVILLTLSFIQLNQQSGNVVTAMIKHFISLFASLGYGIGYIICAFCSKQQKKKKDKTL